jgi:hypothetical protein
MNKKVIKYDSTLKGDTVQVEIPDYDRIGFLRTHLDAIDANLSVFFQRQLEYFESEIQFIQYGELKARKHIPFTARAGDNKVYTWRMFDKVGSWRYGSDENKDINEVNVMGGEVSTPIRIIEGGFKYNIQELLAGKQAATNYPNAPSILIEQQKQLACLEAYNQLIEKIAWFADPTDPSYCGHSGVFYNPYMPTVDAILGSTSGKYKWFGPTGGLVKTGPEIVRDLNLLCTTIRTATIDIYQGDTLLMPIPHYNAMTTNPYSELWPNKTIMQFFLDAHPEIKWIDTLVPAQNVAAGGNISTTSDVILLYKKDPDVFKFEAPRPFTQLPIQEVGYNFLIPCWATVAGIIMKRPKACCMLLGTGIDGVGSN